MDKETARLAAGFVAYRFAQGAAEGEDAVALGLVGTQALNALTPEEFNTAVENGENAAIQDGTFVLRWKRGESIVPRTGGIV